MRHHPIDHDPHVVSPVRDRDRRTRRWARLDDVERTFAVRSMNAYADGVFVSDEQWHRYLDVATHFLPLVRDGQLDIDTLHDLALVEVDVDGGA